MDTLEFDIGGKAIDHKYILTTGKPINGLITEAGFYIIDHYLGGVKQSREKWRKDKKEYHCNWTGTDGFKKSSQSFNYLQVGKQIRETGMFNTDTFKLPPMECFWLDHSVGYKLGFQMTDKTGTFSIADGTTKQQFGDKYPINPSLEREGHIYTTFQPQLLSRVINERTKLIENSDLSLKDEWIFDLRNLISDTISLLDITLNQIYIKAEYDPLPDWTFDKSKIGDRHGRRLTDKLKWIYQITGNNLNIESEFNSFNTLKNLRNHLMHFDPPSLVITLEEATIWLNQIIDIGIILIKIRKAIKAEISLGLVNFILQKEAIFNPTVLAHFTDRTEVGKKNNRDYSSSTWQKI